MQNGQYLSTRLRRKILAFSVLMLTITTSIGTALQSIPSQNWPDGWREAVDFCRWVVQAMALVSTSLYVMATQARDSPLTPPTNSTNGQGE